MLLVTTYFLFNLTNVTTILIATGAHQTVLKTYSTAIVENKDNITDGFTNGKSANLIHIHIWIYLTYISYTYLG